MKIDIPDSMVIHIKDADAIQVWPFYEAPKELQKLSDHGGDEDWLAFIPQKYANQYIGWMEEGSDFGCCRVSTVQVANGMVKIGAHA